MVYFLFNFTNVNITFLFFISQLLGFEVDAINSVQFSNHTGYKHFAGQVLTDKDLGQLAENLSLNNLDFYSHLLTGYVGSPSFLNRIAELIQHLRKINPNVIYGTLLGFVDSSAFLPFLINYSGCLKK